MNTNHLLSEKARAVEEAVIRVMFDKAAKMENVISMGIGEPNQDTDLDICRACAEALMQGNTHYAPNAGRMELRRAIAENGLIAKGLYDPESEIIVTNGGMGAFALVMQVLLDPGDHVLIQDPQYLNFAATVSYCGGVAVRVPTTAESGFCMDPDTIRSLYVPGKTKLLIINSPNNPTGEVIPRDKMEALANVTKELDLLVLFDEVYGTLLYDVAEKETEGKFKWMVESGNLGYSSPDNKYVSQINIRISLEVGTNVDFYLQYDSSGGWEHKFNMAGKGTRTFSVPVIPKRCDHFKYKIVGTGGCKLYSITKTTEQGSDV